ncbi:DNA-directed RNA polymeras-like protein III 25 kDa polypeptide [Byssothecium circinans]|uniref:DNA-directed RNA polymerase subunit n=1 Tax=Byssothecium circinans TaxID=147558 RepID=A0A6A5TM97_9PLEO|nr:DNA-directed RNA polymeras-like protein III 25 kDa polypeptide [Byssothecium circinans]
MFILTTIEDLIQIEPDQFNLTSAQAIKDAINAKYSNKVIQKIGLCLCLWDILQTSEGLIGHGTGLVNVNVEFRMTVFRPFQGEILYGRIKSSTEEGVIIDLDFTSEVFVPKDLLQENCDFDRSENTWVWRHEGGAELFFDKGESVLFRVEREHWTDQKPTLVQKDENGDPVDVRGSAWRLVGAMNQPGLGPTLWWEDAEEVKEEGDEDAEMEDAE